MEKTHSLHKTARRGFYSWLHLFGILAGTQMCKLCLLLFLFPISISSIPPLSFSFFTPRPQLSFCRSSHDQARYPGNYPALSNKSGHWFKWGVKYQRAAMPLQPLLIHTGDKRGDLRAWGTCSEAATTLRFSLLSSPSDKYHQWKQKHAQVHSEHGFICITSPTWPLLARLSF